MNPQRHQQGCHGSRNQSRTQQYLRVKLLHAVFALDEHHASREDEKRVRHVEQGSVEDCLGSEDARNDRISDESHVGKHQGETDHSLVVMVLADEPRHPESEHQQ